MVVSAAKLEANRRNAQKSTGPRTDDGKERSKMNALKHGARAETLVLPEEDPLELEARRAAWTASLGPRTELEQRAVDDAVIYSWRQDRARRAEATRAHARLSDDGLAQSVADEETVLDLGQRLFTDRMGPLTFYPKTDDLPREFFPRESSTSYPGRMDDKPDIPAVLVLRLQSTLAGCEWLLGEWARLKAVLDEDQPWIAADKLKAVRLLGRQPLDVLDDREVALVYLASHRLKPDSRGWAWEILTEMDEKNRKRFRSNAADRRLESLEPADADQARQALLALIGRATDRLTVKLEAHRQRERARADRAAALLAFDETPEGERLRRFEITSGRGYTRAIDTFLKLRKEDQGQRNLDLGCEGADRQSFVVSSQLSGGPLVDGDDLAAATAGTNAPNEPTAGSRIFVANPLCHTDCAMNATDVPNANEPTAVPESCRSERDGAREKPTNVRPNNSCIEPGSPPAGGLDSRARDAAGTNGGAAGRAPSSAEGGAASGGTEITFDKVRDFLIARIDGIQRQRAERLRKFNERSREEARGPRATRRSRGQLDPTPVTDSQDRSRRRGTRSPSLTSG